MSHGSFPSPEPLRLDRMSGFGGAVVLNLALWCGGGVLLGCLGVSGILEGAKGLVGVVAWLLVALGFSLAVASGLILGLSWRNGRPAIMTRDGVTVPGRIRSALVPWSNVEKCEIRPAAKGGQLLLARFTQQHAISTGSELLFLGKIPSTATSEQDFVARVDLWIAQARRDCHNNSQ
jgi:hypothetical protein